MKHELMKDYGYEDDWFDDFFLPYRRKSKYSLMKTDIEENSNSYILSIEVPGVTKENINISLEDGYLNVSVKNEHSENRKDDYGQIHRERYSGSYSRSFYLGDVQEENIKAKLDNGLLTLNIPKRDPKEEKKKIISLD